MTVTDANVAQANPIVVVLDTTALPRRWPVKASLLRLGDLVRGGLVLAYVPTIADREWTSQRYHEMEEAIDQIKALIGRLQTNPWFPASSLGLKALRTAIESVEGLQDSYPWHQWESEGKVRSKLSRIVPLKNLPRRSNHTERVWHAYFRGEAPFRKARHRDDIPDAYVAQAVIDQAEAAQYGTYVYFISADRRLKVLEDDRRLVVLDELDKLFLREELTAKINPSSPDTDTLLAALQGVELRAQVNELISKRTIDIYDEHDWYPGSRDIAPVMWKQIEDFHLDSERVEAWGGGWLSLPFRAYQDVLVEEDRLCKEISEVEPDRCKITRYRLDGKVGIRMGATQSARDLPSVDKVLLEKIVPKMEYDYEDARDRCYRITRKEEDGWLSTIIKW